MGISSNKIQLLLTGLFVFCFVFSILINYILLRFSQTLGIRSKQFTEKRWSPTMKPSLGGISFYVVFLLAFIFLMLGLQGERSNNVQLIGVLIAASLAFMMGLADDAFNTIPLLKFLVQLFCSIILIFTGNGITIFQNIYLNHAFTILWVIGIMNSLNMLDNMDGITTIVSAVICCFVIAMNISLRQTTNSWCILSLGVLGALCGFLIFNFHPSKMFMGDTGSQFLGLFLAAAGIESCWNNPIHNATSIPLPLVNMVVVGLVFLITLTDTITVVVNRMKVGKSPFVGGKDHTTHHLFFKGITEKRIALLFCSFSGVAAGLAYHLILNFSDILLYVSIFYILFVFLILYLNTVLKRRGKAYK
jgi:UDP-GlcNAc:undecaprenyl-phosphate/decaprenyl-phosphate GlcNAc-1-phosphate transferase